jgi:hypothetical protein
VAGSLLDRRFRLGLDHSEPPTNPTHFNPKSLANKSNSPQLLVLSIEVTPNRVRNHYIMPKDKTMSDVLRAAVNAAIDNGATFREIERGSGVIRQSLMPFARGEQSLQLSKADLLARYFQLELRPVKKAR